MRISASIPYKTGVLAITLLTICLDSSAQSIDFGKSYINVTKGTGGGTVEPGDVLEIRASIVVRTGTFDSCAYFDAIPAGTTYITNTIRVLTNEGKVYKSFTDAVGDDQGWISGGNVRINLGYDPAAAPATVARRGRIVNTHKPSFYGGTCIMIASFRVTVTAAYNSTISIGGGSMTYKPSASSLTSFVFPGRVIAVYKNVGICPNAIGANALGTEFNGTFGSGKPRNRGTSSNVPTGYTYSIFTSGGPNDYFYGIPNNTSINTGYTATAAWPNPDAVHRVFSVWDIIGDHTNATNPNLGNPPADTVAKNNAGYMLVINAAYRIDSAFQQTISGLCPNTYYEISLWMRNICSRCGCDSAGRGASNAGYIPTAPGDSSGVYPNLSFNVNGVDYYSTGNILYTGNWIKKGFTFLTGPSQTSFTLKVFNNAPGGGGNDWALDDISVATCSPNLAFTPNNAPVVCANNVVDFGAWIRSYFNNYVYYKWQKSTDAGGTWADASAVLTGTPVLNGGVYEYYTAYPTFVAGPADSGLKFRVVVGSTASNILDPACSFADAASILTLNVINCGTALSTEFISVDANREQERNMVRWTTTRELIPVHYQIEGSFDGQQFRWLANIDGLASQSEVNYYTWPDPQGYSFYRIRLVAEDKQKLSKILRVSQPRGVYAFATVQNPFSDELLAEVNSSNSQPIQLILINQHGQLVRKQSFTLSAGTNNLRMDQTSALPSGVYTLQLQTTAGLISKRIVKQ